MLLNHSDIFVHNSQQSVMIVGDTADLEACMKLFQKLGLIFGAVLEYLKWKSHALGLYCISTERHCC